MINEGYKYVSQSVADYDDSIVKSARRVLQVFEFFAEHRRPASASDIAEGLGFPQSSTSMLLRSLLSLGYLRYDHQWRLFEPSLKLALLGGWKTNGLMVAGDILSSMEKLHEATGETVMLSEQFKHFVRHVFVLQTRNEERLMYTPHGTLRPICTTAPGRMLLTLKTEREVRSIIHRVRTDEDSLDRGIDVGIVLAAVERCRTLGYAETSRTSQHPIDSPFAQIAMLLPKRTSDIPLAITISSTGDRLAGKRDLILEAMCDLLGMAMPIPA